MQNIQEASFRPGSGTENMAVCAGAPVAGLRAREDKLTAGEQRPVPMLLGDISNGATPATSPRSLRRAAQAADLDALPDIDMGGSHLHDVDDAYAPARPGGRSVFSPIFSSASTTPSTEVSESSDGSGRESVLDFMRRVDTEDRQLGVDLQLGEIRKKEDANADRLSDLDLARLDTEAELEGLRDEVEELREAQNATDDTILETIDIVVSTDAEVGILQDAQRQAREEIAKNTGGITNLQVAVAGLRDELVDTLYDHDVRLDELDIIRLESEGLQDEVEDLRESQNATDETVLEMVDLIVSTQSELDMLQEEQAQTGVELASNAGAIDANVQHLADMSADMADLQEDLANVHELVFGRYEEQSSRFDDMEKDVEDLAQDLEDTAMEFGNLEMSVDAVQSELRSNSEGIDGLHKRQARALACLAKAQESLAAMSADQERQEQSVRLVEDGVRRNSVDLAQLMLRQDDEAGRVNDQELQLVAIERAQLQWVSRQDQVEVLVDEQQHSIKQLRALRRQDQVEIESLRTKSSDLEEENRRLVQRLDELEQRFSTIEQSHRSQSVTLRPLSASAGATPRPVSCPDLESGQFRLLRVDTSEASDDDRRRSLSPFGECIDRILRFVSPKSKERVT